MPKIFRIVFLHSAVFRFWLIRDLAEMYQVETKVLNQAVKRNIERFPKKNRFQLSDNEKTHDRFLLIDSSEVYHIGASLKDIGKKWFAFSKMDKLSISVLKEVKNRISIK